MLSLEKLVLPESVEVSGRLVPIHTGHPYIIRFLGLLEKKSPLSSFDFIYREPPKNTDERVARFKKVLDFIEARSPLPRNATGGEKVLDYTLDADLIYAAFMECYGIDLFARPLHWWKFQALLSGITGTKLNDVISYRLFTPTGRRDSYEKAMMREREAWSLETEDKSALDEFNSTLAALKGQA